MISKTKLKETILKENTLSVIPYEYNLTENKSFQSLNERQTGVDVEVAFDKTLNERNTNLEINNDQLNVNCIVDKPKTFIREYLHEERQRNMKIVNINKKHEKTLDVKKKKNPRNKVCYTCFPRKQVSNHIIFSDENIVFHHDLCNRPMIIATPTKHYSTFEEIPDIEIGILFRKISEFCINWNIEDYNISYNQGEWQNHKHFHVKIKTHDKLIKRMRGDHFRMINLQKIYS